jgi:hypothetical protein
VSAKLLVSAVGPSSHHDIIKNHARQAFFTLFGGLVVFVIIGLANTKSHLEGFANFWCIHGFILPGVCKCKNKLFGCE